MRVGREKTVLEKVQDGRRGKERKDMEKRHRKKRKEKKRTRLRNEMLSKK